jgi:uncharacterized protein YjbJ (UPF0337 family)
LLSQTTGKLHSVKGTAVETLGDLTGSTYLKEAGRDEHAAGEEEVNISKVKAQGEATMDKVVGTKDSVLGAVTGDKEQQVSGRCHVPSSTDRVSLFPVY